MDNYLVYIHTRPSNNEIFYVGKGKQHRIRQKCGRNIYWKRIVDKENGFNSQVIAGSLTEKEALAYEVLMISKLKEAGCKLSNLTIGGDGVSGYKHSSEQIAKWSAERKGKESPTKGMKFSDERKKQMSLIHLGRKQSEEWIKNASVGRIGRIKSEETKKKLSIAHKGRKIPLKQYLFRLKPVVCLTTKEWFLSVSEASRKFNLPTSNISRCCKGIFKQTGGHQFTYAPTLTGS
jgi:hypothetical protein